MRPLISYYGGKQRIASKIVPFLQAIPHTVYAEPFAGGLAVLYAKPIPFGINFAYYREAINDTSGLLVNLYRVAQQHPEEFSRLIDLTPYAKDEYSRAVEICKNHQKYDELEKAWAYFVSINTSFCHQLNNGWGRSVVSKNLAATWEHRKIRLPQALGRLQHVHVDNQDALAFISSWDSPQTLFYVDPPYLGTNQGHYSGYTEKDYQALCDLLDNIEGSYVLSGYPQENSPKSAQKIVEIKTAMSASGKGKVRRIGKRAETPTQEELGNRERIERLWICNRSGSIRQSLNYALEEVSHSIAEVQFTLF